MLKTQEERRSAMQELPVSRLIPEMALPAIVAFLINAVYNLADTYFVSSLGTNATAAVSVNASLDQILVMAGSLLAIGANSYISRLLGAKRDEYASRVLSTAFFLAAGAGIAAMIPGMLFIHPLVRLLGATNTCENYAVDYAAYILLVAPVMTCSFVMNQSLRAEGSAMHSMIGMGFGGVLNCLIDPIFIFRLEMGVAGASLATALSKVVSAAILLFPYITHRSLLRLSIRTFRPNRDILTQIIAVGSSSMLRSGLAVVSAVMLNNLAGNISDSLLAGLGVATKVMMFPFGIIMGFGTGFQPVVGFSLGAKRYDRLMESYRFASKTALIGAGLIGLGLGLFSGNLISLFGESDSAMREIGALSIRLQCLVLPIHAWVSVVNMLCAATGRAKEAMLLATARQGTCFLPLLPLLAYVGGAYGIAAAQAAADVLTLLLAVPAARRVIKQIQAKASDSLNSL